MNNNNNTKKVYFTVLSQAPFESFGDILHRDEIGVIQYIIAPGLSVLADKLGIGAYKGDGNDIQFTPDNNASAKLQFTADIDLEKETLINFGCISPQGTTFLRTGEHATARTHKNATLNPNNNTLEFSYAGANPIAVAAPDIDVNGKLQFTNEENGDLHIKGTLHGDGFPATSAFVHFLKDNAHGVMLGSAPLEVGTSKDTGVLKLGGEGNTKIMDIDISIKFDKNHIPTHVINHLDKNKTYTIEQWNNLHKDKPMLTPTPEVFKCSQEPFMDNHNTCVQDQSQMLHSLSNQKTSNEQINTSSKYTIVNNGIKLHADTNTTKAEDIKRAPNSTVDSISAGKDFVKDLNLSTDNSDNSDQGYGIGD